MIHSDRKNKRTKTNRNPSLQGLFQCGRRWPTVDSPLSANTVREMVETFSSVLGAENIVKPDDLRGSYESLQAALQDKGADNFWPDVDSVRGKFFIIGGGMVLLFFIYPPLEMEMWFLPSFSRFLGSRNLCSIERLHLPKLWSSEKPKPHYQ